MPKMKTSRAAKARYKITGSGKVLRRKVNRGHILEKKSPTRKRRLSGTTEVTGSQRDRVRRQLGI
jgi:large subunit ribosomal protein L35